MQKLIAIGNLTKDPALFSTKSGIKVARFGIAIGRNFKDESGNRITDFFDVIAWKALGENCVKYLKKGNKVAVVGEVQRRSYKDEKGNTREAIEIIAEQVDFLTPKTETCSSESDTVGDDAIPF